MSKELFERFARARTRDVFHWFGSLPRAYRGDRFLYIPGTREDACLLVAHADTVFTHPPTHIEWAGNIATAKDTFADWWKGGSKNASGYSSYRAPGLGADDRAGCAMVWTFRNSGHSILITDEEEVGCVGAGLAGAAIGEELSNHRFAIEIDRRGDCNYVFYDVSTPEFEDHVAATLRRPWNEQVGSYSDIAELCKWAGICGVNLAAGYWYEHSSNEIFYLDAWHRTRAAVERLLASGEKRFVLPDAEPRKVFRYGNYSWYGYDTVDTDDIWEEYERSRAAAKADVDAVTEGDAIPHVSDICVHNWVQSIVYNDLWICRECYEYSNGLFATAEDISLEYGYTSGSFFAETEAANTEALRQLATPAD